MKTILITLEYPPFKGGVASYYDGVIKNWPQDEKIEVINNNNKELVDNKLLFLKWRKAFKTLNKKIKKGDYVLVGNILPLGTVVWILSKFKKFDYSVFIHGTDIAYAQKKIRKKWLAKIILKNAKNIIVNSHYTAELVKDFFWENEKIKIVEPGINPKIQNIEHKTQLKEKYNLKNKKVLFSVGRLIKRKGVDSVIKLMPEILKKHNDVVYVIGGRGEDEEYLKKLASGNEKIIFLDRLSDKEKWAWFDICDIFVQPARSEKGNFDGFGIVYLEANLMSKPVIAGRSGGVVDAVKDGLNGLMVDPENSEEIKNAILKLLDDKNLREKLGRQGKIRAEKDFNWQGQAKKIYKIIENLQV